MKVEIYATSTMLGGCRCLAYARSFEGALKRLDKDCGFWREMGWECFEIYTDGSPMLLEDLRGRRVRREISKETYLGLRGNVSG